MEDLRLHLTTAIAVPTHFLSGPPLYVSLFSTPFTVKSLQCLLSHCASSLAGRLHCSSFFFVCVCLQYPPFFIGRYNLIRINVCIQTLFGRARSTESPLMFCLSRYFYFILCVLQQARAEQEEEFISNTLFKKIQALQKEKETLAVNYEKEEEFLTNELSRKLMQVSDGKLSLV